MRCDSHTPWLLISLLLRLWAHEMLCTELSLDSVTCRRAFFKKCFNPRWRCPPLSVPSRGVLGGHNKLGYMVRVLFPLISARLFFVGHNVPTIFTLVCETAVERQKISPKPNRCMADWNHHLFWSWWAVTWITSRPLCKVVFLIPSSCSWKMSAPHADSIWNAICFQSHGIKKHTFAVHLGVYVTNMSWTPVKVLIKRASFPGSQWCWPTSCWTQTA